MRMKQLLATIIIGTTAAFASTATLAADITGAGSTFAYPIYSKWAEMYKKTSGNGLNYQSIGSGAGIKQIKAKTVDFGASDMPLPAEELNEAGLMQFPTIMGGVVAIVNLEGVAPGQLKLTGPVLADIYLGKVTKWNDKEIAALNPGVKLPAEDITVVHRADGSGTSFLFTNYLSQTNPEFKQKIGAGTAVKWVVGVGGKGNDGVAANVQRIKGSIGYVEWAYSKKNKLAHTQLKNHDGNFLQPDDDNFKAAAANADWARAPGFDVVLTDQAGKNAWPITGVTYALVHKQQADAAKGKEVLSFFNYAFKNGAAAATELDYVPMPESVIKLVETAWKNNLKDSSGKAIW
ncbi:phosphate ABC transporter substrate-binding protein PstS [Massilia putida]|uniref:phosphate ABC transporter substrate-binding protein PstS n=1 Tax=Massilia putida TaxID=1141883 RepID=UPI000951A8CC|nr:phosphate ABC transporter substrate-binding protein PstS [Massilia putida]